MGTLPRYLVQRESGWYARLAVPEKLRPLIGKRELWAPVKATSKAHASRLLPAVVATLQAELEAARHALGNDPAQTRPPRPGQALSPRQMATAFYAEELARDQTERDAARELGNGLGRQFNPGHEAALRKVASGTCPDDEAQAIIGWVIDDFRERDNTKAAKGTDEWRDLAKALASVHLETLKRVAERDQGNFNGAVTLPLLQKPAPAPGDPLAARMLCPDSGKSLKELLPDYLKERAANARTDYDSVVTVRMLDEYLGESKPLYQLTRADIRGFKTALMEVPAHYKKRFGDVPLPKAIKLNKKRATPYPVLNFKTIGDKYLSKLHSLLNWCLKNDLIPDNPANGIQVETVKSREKPRTRFMPSDLGKIFDPKKFAPNGQYGEPQWAALISLFAGTRASELAQIKLDSIRTYRDVLTFEIEEETKTAGSVRKIPVHPKLLELGLRDRIDALRKSGATHLFPEWYEKSMSSRSKALAKATAKGGLLQQDKHFSRFIPKRFNDTYLPSVGIHDKDKTFHSFRHTFLTGLVESGVEDDMRKALGGHVDRSASAGYVHGFSIERLNEAMKKLRYDGFPL